MRPYRGQRPSGRHPTHHTEYSRHALDSQHLDQRNRTIRAFDHIRAPISQEPFVRAPCEMSSPPFTVSRVIEDAVLGRPDAARVRDELQALVVRDLYGPDDDEVEEFTERPTERYLLDRLAPRAR